MPYGSPYGSPWAGGGGPAIASEDRVLMFTRSPNMLALAQALLDLRSTRVLAPSIIEEIRIDSIVSDILDMFGGLLARPRNGLSDTRYRDLLEIQTRLLQSGSTTTPTILDVVAIFTGVDPISYAEAYPSGFTVGARVDAADADLLVEILQAARAATYEAAAILAFSDTYLRCDSTSTPITGALVMGSVSSTVTGEGDMGSVRVV